MMFHLTLYTFIQYSYGVIYRNIQIHALAHMHANTYMCAIKISISGLANSTAALWLEDRRCDEALRIKAEPESLDTLLKN